MCPTDVRPDASRIEAAVPSLRIGVVRISDALGNRPDVNIAVVNVPAFRSRGHTLHQSALCSGRQFVLQQIAP